MSDNLALADALDPERLGSLARTERDPRQVWANRLEAMPAHDAEFRALQEAYRSTGGIGRGESLAQRMSLIGTGGYVDLARRLVQREVFSFQWHDDFWLPMFQFDAHLLTPCGAIGRVLAALLGPGRERASRAPDGWALAHWFVTPDEMLEGLTPLCLIDVRTDAVIAAAVRQRLKGLRPADESRRGRSS